MTALATLALDQNRADIQRWSLAAVVALGAHSALAGAYLLAPAPPPEAPLAPAVIVELAPLPVAPRSRVDVAPGPRMQASQPQPPPGERPTAQPSPKIERPAPVMLPISEPKPIERKSVETPRETPNTDKSRPPRAEPKPPAPRTTANLHSEHRTAPVARAPRPGSSASRAAMASWRDLVLARLQRTKRYPYGAEARGDEGVVTLRFSVDRHGRVLSRRIMTSSGHAALDREVLAMIARAQPLPPFPPQMTQSVVHLSVPIRFSLR